MNPPSDETAHRVKPGCPRRVRIWTTPFDASVPNSTLAAGPLATWIASRSSGLMSLIRDGCWPPTPTDADCALFSIRMPSTTSTGSFDSETLLEPRMRMRVPVPVVPPLGNTVTPGVRPIMRSLMFVGRASRATAAASMLCGAVPCSRTAWFPVAVTTTASSPIADGTSAKSAVAVCPALTVTDCTVATYPMKSARTGTVPGDTTLKR